MNLKLCFILCIGLPILACTPRTVYVPAECPSPASYDALRADLIDTTLPVNEQVRELVLRYSQCVNAYQQCDEAISPYRR